MKKRILPLLLTLVISLSLMVAPAFADYFFVPEANWMQTYVEYTGTTTCTDRGAEQTVYLYPSGTQLLYPMHFTEIYDLNTGSVVDPVSVGQEGTFYLPTSNQHIYRFAYEGSGQTYYYYVQSDSASTPVVPTEQPSSWAVDAVNNGIELGIVPDALQSKYTQAATRAEFCALATRLYETVKGQEITVRKTFTDTTDVNVEKMAALEVVNGTGDGIFEPNTSLTREQAATILSRLAAAIGQQLPAGNASFADNAKIADWAIDAVGQMQAADIMNGIENNQFDPAGDYTREQSIVTIMRLYDYIQ